MKKSKKLKRMLCAALSLSMVCSFLPIQSVSGAESKSVRNAQSSTISEESTMEKVDGTTGVPLGGFGAGAVKFNAMKGSFAAITLPPADWRDYVAAGKSRFQLYSNVGGSVETADTLTAVSENGRYDDDAVWPIHSVNFGETNGIQINLEGISPLDNENYENMSRPYALYEVTLKNNNNTEAEAAVALLWDVTVSGGTAASLSNVGGKGFKSDRWAVYAEADGAEITSGSDSGFMKSGICNNSPSAAETRTAAKLKLAANETKTIKFVLSWYNNEDPENAHYLGLHDNAGEIAQLGLENFDTLKENAEGLVSRMRSSDVPAWFMNQCLNSLANISNNSMYKKDGRVAFSEGMWTCFGTMDQMWHARPIMVDLIPELVWTELEYWARTQRNDGQIHHDFNYMADTSVKSKLVSWDDTEHADYRNIDQWVDLNCGFIISIYEAYQRTGNEEKLAYFWPYMKKAGQRIFDQVELYGDTSYPYTFAKSSNSYDAGGDPNPFNASISAVAYKVMSILSEKMGETDLKAKYCTAYDTVVQSYSDRYIKNGFDAGRISESFFAGQWLAMHLKLGQIWTAEETDKVIESLDDYYHPYYKLLGYPDGTYDEWTPYLLAHYGGLLLHTQRQNQYEALQRDAYNRQYKNRNQVFNQQLGILPSVTVANYTATSISGKQQYISTPTIWRNYYDVIGYRRDLSTKELWLEPLLLPEMNHTMTSAAYVSAEGYGTISCKETASQGSEAYQNKDITFKPEQDTYVSKLYLEDNFGSDESITVTIEGESCDFERIGEGYTRELVIEYNKTVTSDGIRIVTSGEPGNEPPEDPEKPDDLEVPPTAAELSAYTDIQAEKTSASGGLESGKDSDGTEYVTGCDDQDYAQYNSVGFEDGAGAIVLKIRSTKTSRIELALGSVGGETVQELDIPNTDGVWKEIRFELAEVISGTNNVVFRFRSNTGESADLLDIDSFKFEYKYKLSNKNWKASASKNNNLAVNAIDGDTTTRWFSGVQTGGEWFVLDLGEKSEFNRLVLTSTEASKNDYPRKYEVYVSDDGVSFDKKIALGEGTQVETDITFERQQKRYIKIVQLGSAEVNYWSIYEMTLYNDAEEYGDGTLPGDRTINEYTYSGTASAHADDTKYFDIEKYKLGQNPARNNADNNEYYFADTVSDEVKALFADKKDKKKISSTYTCRMVNFIGHSGTYNNKPAIVGEEMEPGEYKLYFIGGNKEDQSKRAIEITFENDKNSEVKITKTGGNIFSTSNNGLYIHEFKIEISKPYSGDITFGNSTTWLPDLYAVKMVKVADANSQYAYKINNISFTSETGESYDNAPSDKAFLVDVELEKQQARNGRDYIFVAVYDEAGALLSLDYVRAEFAENNTYTFGFYVPKQNKEIGQIKAFVWNSFDGAEPLSKTAVFE